MRLRQHPAARVIVTLLLVLAGLELIYLVIANLLIWTGAIEAWASDPRQKLTLEHGYTLLPGRVKLRGAALLRTSGDAVFELSAERLKGRVSLIGLATRRIVVRDVQAQGGAIRVSRTELGQETTARASGALAAERRWAAAGLGRGAGGGEWTADIHAARLELREMKILDYRLEGVAHATGEFIFDPGDKLRIAPSRVDIESGTLTFRETVPVASSITGSLRLSVPETLKLRIASVLDAASGELDVRADVGGARFISEYLEPMLGISVDGGAGGLVVEAKLAQGTLQPTTVVEYRTRELTLGWRGLQATGGGEIVYEVAKPDEARARLKLEPAAIRPVDAAVAPAVVQRASALLTFSSSRIGARWPAHATVTLEEGALPDVRTLNALAGPDPGWMALRGSGRFGAQFERTPAGALAGTMAVELTDAAFSFGELEIAGDAQIDSRLTSSEGTLSHGTLVDLDAVIEKGVLRTSSGASAPGRLRFSSPSLRYEGVLPRVVRGPFLLEVSDAVPLLRAAGVFAQIPAFVTALLDLRHVRAQGTLEKNAGVWDLTITKATSSGLAARGRFLRGAAGTHAAFLFERANYSVGAAVHPDSATAQLMADTQWLEQQLASFPKPAP